jgi:hypothetical protein
MFTNCPRRAPFTYDAWKSPEVLQKISEVAGIDLVPSIDFEIANINITVPDKNADVEKVVNLMSNQDLPAVSWHYDSFPFVCVTMLSDCSGMVGGETAMRSSKGDIMKIRGPAMVSQSSSKLRIQHLTCSPVAGNGRGDARTVYRAPGSEGPWRSGAH